MMLKEKKGQLKKLYENLNRNGSEFVYKKEIH